MMLPISAVLSQETLDEVKSIVAELEFRDGKATAGWHARTVKDNSQASPSAALRLVQRRIAEALRGNEVFRAAALPLRLVPPLVARYGPGQAYGTHVDDAVMAGDPPVRSDLSVTLFLSDPAAYEGGELVIETPGGEDAIKLAAGDALLYPSTTLHRVAPVTRGERLVAVTWVQSLVRDTGLRETLFDLERARRSVFEREGKTPLFDLLAKAHANLTRRFAET